MAELLAENYHNIWARKKKIELEAKGKYNTSTDSLCLFHHHQDETKAGSLCQCEYNTNHADS